MKKIYAQPELSVICFDKEIRTSIIEVSGGYHNNVRGDAADRMGREDWSWDAGY